jgi:serine/threonine-protein kinase
MTPDKIGQYTIIRELGRGGMATVYLATDPRFDREVALKVLPREFLHDPQFRVRFEREARTIAALEHSAIVPVYDVGEDEGQPFYVMRYMTGGSLSDRLKKGPFTVEQAAKILQRLASALDEAHAKGIVHRDLKPANILFDKGGEPYISDFGIAKLTQSQTNVTGSAIVGTPSYISPEQGQGMAVDGRADIYALGTILFEMFSGRTPYEADTPMGLVVKHITEPVPHILDFNPNLPVAIDSIIKKAMAKDREERFQTAGMLSKALDAVVTGQPFDLETTLAKKTNIAKTRIGAAKTAPAEAVVPTPAKKFNLALVWVPALILILGLGLVGMIFAGDKLLPFAKTEPTSTTTTQSIAVIQPSATEKPTTAPTDTPIPATDAPAEAPTPTLEPTPAVFTLGGADKIAFVANSDVWVMDADGSDPTRLTIDGKDKTDLQWLPDGQNILYISGKCIKTVDLNQVENVITCFETAEYLDAVRVSPDGTQIAISLNRELFIIPFDLRRLSTARIRSDLVKEDTCLEYTSHAVEEVRWAADGKQIAIILRGVSGNKRIDLVHILDISRCKEAEPALKDEFPGVRFEFSGLEMPDFDWDGSQLFLMNSDKRNGGFGYLYAYNAGTHKGQQIDPLGSCCYRDARFTPDGTFIILTYQDERLGAAAPIQLYLIRYGEITAGGTLDPIPLPQDFFRNPREKTQPAFRPAP